jgi:MoxR-like ATPase
VFISFFLELRAAKVPASLREFLTLMEAMQQIIDVHFPNLKDNLVREALTVFYDIRQVPGLKKKPSTSELLDWIKLLLVEDISPEVLRMRDPAKLIPPLHGALLKNEQDVHLFERLAFLHRRERG